MTSTRQIVLVALAATVIAGGLMTGCEDDHEWDHPNRVRYPAPADGEKSDSQVRSLEELQRDWRQQDMQRIHDEQTQRARVERPHQAQDEQAVDAALGMLRRAVHQAVREANVLMRPPERVDQAIGGGPPPEADPEIVEGEEPVSTPEM